MPLRRQPKRFETPDNALMSRLLIRLRQRYSRVGMRSVALFFLLIGICPIAFAGDSPKVRFSGGDGLTLDSAVVIIGAPSEAVGARAEYSYLAAHFPGSKVNRQALLSQNGKSYDRLDITTPTVPRRQSFSTSAVFSGNSDYFSPISFFNCSASFGPIPLSSCLK
jgi:hypothetical protein